jgi:ABC-type multidrug transport system ATPase subunit
MNDTTLGATRAPAIRATGLTMRHRNGTTALDDITLTIAPGRLSAVIGPSGAGKTTLLKALAGILPAQGEARFTSDGSGLSDPSVGFVPQDDILHVDLPLRRTLQHAGALRIAAPAAAVNTAVTDAMAVLGLTERADVPVRSLSGGQRKRASIAAEVLTRPDVLFLDEPTSGLDPAAAANLIAHLRRMSADGSTVVFTTHRVEDIAMSEQVVVLGPGGRLAAVGPPEDVLHELHAATFVDLYDRLAGDEPSRRAQPNPPSPPTTLTRFAPAARPSMLRQWLVLTRRSFELQLANRLTLAIIIGSPAAVIAMFATLFRPGALDPTSHDAIAGVQVAYWLAFSGFFFGLTFGLLQVCTEVPVLQRERRSGVRTSAYVASKLALLTPLLLVVDAAMLTALRALDRIPTLPKRALAELFLTMGGNAVAALCLGLLVSALVHSSAQAAVALPMLCFPAVLFAGAIVPLPAMTGPGRFIASVLPDRWAFEAIAKHLRLDALMPAASPYASLGASPAPVYWALLLLFTGILCAGAYAAALRRAASDAWV